MKGSPAGVQLVIGILGSRYVYDSGREVGYVSMTRAKEHRFQLEESGKKRVIDSWSAVLRIGERYGIAYMRSLFTVCVDIHS